MANEPKWPKVPKTEYESALGPIPPEHFDDDLPFRDDTDKSQGSLYDHISQRIKAVLAKPFYGSFDGFASRYTEREAWVLHDDWAQLNSSSVNNAVRELTKEEFDQLFPNVPPLPSTAFSGDVEPLNAEKALLDGLTPREGRLGQQVVDDHPGLSVEKANPASGASSDLTSAGVPWSEVPDFAVAHVEWLDGRHGSAEDGLPSVDQFPIPDVLFALPVLHPRRPTGSKAMGDVHGARQRLANCRPGAWLISPYSGWRWAKWPNGEVGWLSAEIVLPDCLRVR